MSKYITQFYPCDTCGTTPYESNCPHIYCDMDDCDWVGCDQCHDEHMMIEHGTTRLEEEHM